MKKKMFLYSNSIDIWKSKIKSIKHYKIIILCAHAGKIETYTKVFSNKRSLGKYGLNEIFVCNI